VITLDKDNNINLTELYWDPQDQKKSETTKESGTLGEAK